MQGIILGVTLSVCILALAILIKETNIEVDDGPTAWYLFLVLLFIILISGGIAGWAFSTLL